MEGKEEIKEKQKEQKEERMKGERKERKVHFFILKFMNNEIQRGVFLYELTQ